MLLYCNKSYFRIICCYWGSVFWRYDQILRGLLIAVCTGILQHLIFIESDYAPRIPDKFAMHAVGVVVGFAAVFRTNLGWARYWEAVTQLHFMYSKWGDAYSQIFAFASVTIERSLTQGLEGQAKAKRLEERLQRLLRNFTLMSAIAADSLAHGDTERMEHRKGLWQKQVVKREELTREEDPDANTMPVFTDGMAACPGRHNSVGSVRSTPNEWSRSQYIIQEMPQEVEMEILHSSTDRPSLVMYWIIHDLAEMSSDLAIAPPIQSRMYQELSNGMLALNQAQKIADVPFPFSYAQLMSILITCYTCFIPVYVAVFTQSSIAGPIMAFFLFQGMWGINLSATELENPFGSDVNDITLVDFHDRFLDLCTEVHLGHRVKAKATMQRGGRGVEVLRHGRKLGYPKMYQADSGSTLMDKTETDRVRLQVEKTCTMDASDSIPRVSFNDEEDAENLFAFPFEEMDGCGPI